MCGGNGEDEVIAACGFDDGCGEGIVLWEGISRFGFVFEELVIIS